VEVGNAAGGGSMVGGSEAGGSPGRRVGATEISGRACLDPIALGRAAVSGAEAAPRMSIPHHSQIVSQPRTGARQCTHRPGGENHNRTSATGPRIAPNTAHAMTSRSRRRASHAEAMANPSAHARTSPVTTGSTVVPPVRSSTLRPSAATALRYEKAVCPV
jgi:hypothetical protein